MFSAKLSAMFGVLLFAAMSVAQPPHIDVPAEVKPAGQYVRFTPKTDAVSVEYVGLSGVDAFPSAELADKRRFLLDVRGLAQGRYIFAAVASSKTGEQIRVDFVVVIGNVPPGPAPIPPGPNPVPVPVDPLITSLRDAAAKDSFPKIRLADLGDGFRAIVTAVDARSTGGEIKTASRTILANSIGGPIKAPNLLAVLSKELTPLDSIFPTDETQATPEKKEAAKAIFNKLATVCIEAAK